MLLFNLEQVPFSRFGSFLAISRPPHHHVPVPGLYLRTVRGAAQRRELLRLELIREGQSIPFRETATPSQLRLEADQGYVEICFAAPDTLRMRGVDVGLRLVGMSDQPHTPFEYAFSPDGQRWEIVSYV